MPQRSQNNPGFGAYARNFKAGGIPPQALSTKNFRYVYDEFRGPIISQALGGAIAAGTTGVTNQIQTNGPFPYVLEQFNLGAGQTIITPVLIAANGGMDIGQDQTSTEGADYTIGAPQAGTTAGKCVFQARKDRAFFARLRFSIEDVSGVNPFYFGWKKCTAANATFATGATDYATLAIITAADPASVQTSTRLNSGTATSTVTGLTLADTVVTTWAVYVDGDGYARMTVDGVTTGESGFRLDDSDYVCPFFRVLNAADLAGVIALRALEVGFKDR